MCEQQPCINLPGFSYFLTAVNETKNGAIANLLTQANCTVCA